MFDREGPAAAARIKATAWGVFTGIFTFLVLLTELSQRISSLMLAAVAALLIALAAGFLTTFGVLMVSDGAGAVAKSFTLPSGNSTPYEQQFSYQEALAARGDVAGALESYEAVIAEQPTATAPRMKAAEHYARGNRNLKRAAELFREIRSMEGVTSRDALYASSRLVDLYDGPLAEPGRALVELRRIIDQFPTSNLAAHARVALPELKARLELPPAD